MGFNNLDRELTLKEVHDRLWNLVDRNTGQLPMS